METPIGVLKDIFGYSEFRNGQEEIITSSLDYTNNGILVVMPTGGGKSLLYQIPSILAGDLNIVVSPLISLMKDQVDTLRRKSVSVELYNSTLTKKEKDAVRGSLAMDIVNILYVAPERFDDDGFLDLLRACKINMFAVDEAHCISSYGHDFRPSYRRLKNAIDILKPKQVIALTATATPKVQKDICDQLGIPQAKKFIKGFYRDNLVISINECNGDRINDVASQVKKYYDKKIKTGIIYAGTRNNAEALSELLNNTYSVPTTFYHAGMKADDRERIQNNWAEHGGYIIATCAFGMGIDRPDVRFVIHFGLSGNIESWYQEIGRAGRDGKNSICKMYWDSSDIRLQNYFINISTPPVDTVRKFWDSVNKQAKVSRILNMTQPEMAEEFDISPEFISGCMAVLRASNLIKKEKAGVYSVTYRPNGDGLNIDYLLQKRKEKKQRLQDMIDFVENTKECRMSQILNYFGENTKMHCGKCDFCLKS